MTKYYGSVVDDNTCPECKMGTRRAVLGRSTTLMHCQPFIDENGNETVVDNNVVTTEYRCLDCETLYSVKRG